MPAIEPQLGLRRGLGQRAAAQPLHPRGPFGAGDGGLLRGLAQPKVAQHGQRGARVLDLVRAGQVGQRQIGQPGFVLEHQPPAFLDRVPVLPLRDQGRTHARGAGLDHLHRRVGLRSDHAGHPALQDAGLFARDLGQRVAQELFVIVRHGRDDRQRRARDHVGRIEPPAKPDLEQRVIRRHPRHRQQRGAGGDLEIGDVVATIGGIAFVQNRAQIGFRDQLAGQPDPLVKPGQVRRGIGVAGQPRPFQPGPDHRQRRTLAVGARDMDDRRQAVLRVAQPVQQAPDPVQRQVDDLGMKRHHPIKDDVGCRAAHLLSAGLSVASVSPSASGASASAPASGAGRSPFTSGGRFSSIRVMVISSSRICPRGVTRSSIP